MVSDRLEGPVPTIDGSMSIGRRGNRVIGPCWRRSSQPRKQQNTRLNTVLVHRLHVCRLRRKKIEFNEGFLHYNLWRGHWH